MKRSMKLILASIFTSTLLATSVYAAGWQQDSVGWWWQNDDGSYLKDQWAWLDGDRDGVAECYYFYPSGYLATYDVIDGYYVNPDGQWVENGEIMRANASPIQTGESRTSPTVEDYQWMNGTRWVKSNEEDVEIYIYGNNYSSTLILTSYNTLIYTSELTGFSVANYTRTATFGDITISWIGDASDFPTVTSEHYGYYTGNYAYLSSQN